MPLSTDAILDVSRINPLNHAGWDDLLLTNPQTSFFHTTHWARVLHDSYNYSPVYFARIDRGKLKTLIPVMEINSPLTGRRGVALPFTDYCLPIGISEVPSAKLLGEVQEYGAVAGWKSIELRGEGNLVLGHDTPASAIFLCHKLKLHRDIDTIFNKFHKGMKSAIKKGIREGVEVSICRSMEALDAFYMLNCLTRKSHGLPPQPHSFFKNIFKNVILNNHGFVSLATYKGNPVSGAVFFYFNKRAIYKYGASDRAYQQFRPNNLTLYEGIRWFCENGFEELSFGRSDMKNTGLIQFKNSFGTEQEIIRYYKYDVRNNKFIQGGPDTIGFHNKIFRNLPLPVLKGIGALLYKHLG